MSLKKYQDWRGWWEGLRSKMMKAGAEALATNITAMLGTNGVASMGIPGLGDIAMGWKTAVATTLIQFTLRTVLAAVLYIQTKPDPDLVERESNSDPEAFTKNNTAATPPQPEIKP